MAKNSNIPHKYSINFDLLADKDSEKELKKYVGISLSRMYAIIKNHLLKNGFDWVQGSGYITKDKILSKDLNDIIRKLFKNNDWLGHFTRDIKRTIVDNNTYSYDSIIKYYSSKFKGSKK